MNINIKKFLIIVLVALVLLAAVLTISNSKKETAAQEQPTQETQNQPEKQSGPSREPDPYGEPAEPTISEADSVATKTEAETTEKNSFWDSFVSIFTKPEEKQEATVPTKAPEISTPAPTTPKTEVTVDTPENETSVQPEGGTTLPPEVDVSMGVEKDDSADTLDKDITDIPASTETTTPQETKPTETKPVETKPVETTPTESTKPTEPKPTESTKPTETQPQETQPTEPTKPVQKPSSTNPLDKNYDLTTLTYEGYMAMTGEQQQAVINKFVSREVFMEWFKDAEAQYKEEHPDIEIGGDGSIKSGNLG